MTRFRSKPWAQVTQHAANLEAELRKEVAPGHPLYMLGARAVAQRIDADDVLFEVDSPDFRYAVVHLCWTVEPEHDPRFPHTEAFASFQEWSENRMKPDSREFL
jgi:hypothetical protein